MFLKNGNKSHLYINNLLKRRSISDSIRHPITRPHFQYQPKAYYSQFHQRNNNVKVIEFSIPFSGVIGWYLHMIKTRPMITKTITSALIFAAADRSSQKITKSSSEPYDHARTRSMARNGLILGPSLHIWFNFVSTLFPNRNLVSTFVKIIMGQAIFAPVITSVFFSDNADQQGESDAGLKRKFIPAVISGSTTFVFFPANAALQGESGLDIVARLKGDLIPRFTGAVMSWPVCDFVTYRYIPVHMQPLVSNLFSYAWTRYLTRKMKAGTK